MSRGGHVAWGRVPREDFDRYLERLDDSPSPIRVRRLARKLALLGYTGPGIYAELAKTGDQDCTNLVLAELKVGRRGPG